MMRRAPVRVLSFEFLFLPLRHVKNLPVIAKISMTWRSPATIRGWGSDTLRQKFSISLIAFASALRKL